MIEKIKNRMKVEIKEKWLKALRSGEYKQGEGSLITKDDEFCCLGVLSDLYLKEHGEAWGDEKDQFPNSTYRFCRGEAYFLSESVMEWAGLKEEDPQIRILIQSCTIKGLYRLSELNDGKESFEEIADGIESQL